MFLRKVIYSIAFFFFLEYNCQKGAEMKTVLVTGASRGIGAEIARYFAKHNYNVVINYCNSDIQAQRLANELCTYGIRAVAIKADVSNALEVQNMINQTLAIFGSIDVLVNNAGVSLSKLLIDSTAQEVRRVIDVNLIGTINVTKAVLPSMINNSFGKIINISSMWGNYGGSMESVYSASKGGIIAFTKAIAKEVGLENININCICPGVVVTDMLNNLTIEDMHALKNQTALGRVAYPGDIAGIVYFLSTDEASYITGACINADGGII